jgi:hypothetical protein
MDRVTLATLPVLTQELTEIIWNTTENFILHFTAVRIYIKQVSAMNSFVQLVLAARTPQKAVVPKYPPLPPEREFEI